MTDSSLLQTLAAVLALSPHVAPTGTWQGALSHLSGPAAPDEDLAYLAFHQPSSGVTFSIAGPCSLAKGIWGYWVPGETWQEECFSAWKLGLWGASLA